MIKFSGISIKLDCDASEKVFSHSKLWYRRNILTVLVFQFHCVIQEWTNHTSKPKPFPTNTRLGIIYIMAILVSQFYSCLDTGNEWSCSHFKSYAPFQQKFSIFIIFLPSKLIFLIWSCSLDFWLLFFSWVLKSHTRATGACW